MVTGGMMSDHDRTIDRDASRDIDQDRVRREGIVEFGEIVPSISGDLT